MTSASHEMPHTPQFEPYPHMAPLPLAQEPQTIAPEKPLPAGWALVNAKEREVNSGETPWVDPIIAAIAENSEGKVVNAIVDDMFNGYDNESPIQPKYDAIGEYRRHRAAPKIIAGLASILIGTGITLALGAEKYELGEISNVNAAPVIPGNSIAFDQHGLPGYANKDKKTGTVTVDIFGPSVILGMSAALGFGLATAGVATALSPSGIRKTARKELKKQQNDLR